VPGTLLRFVPQSLCVSLPLLGFLAEPFGLDFRLLGLCVGTGGVCLPFACFKVLGLGLLPYLVRAFVIFPALLLHMRIATFPSKEND
jgi:hypothetical protein